MRTRRGLCYPRLVSQDDAATTTKKQHEASLFPEMNNKRFSPSPPVHVKNNTKMDGDSVRTFSGVGDSHGRFRKRVKRSSPEPHDAISSEQYCHDDLFDALPDDLVLSILSKLSASASCPSDFINVLITCKRLNGLALQSSVLSKASQKTFAIKAKNWSESAHRFLKLCAEAGNVEACYTLGMIRFYCLENRGSGASLMAKAAMASHAPALYSLAIVQFNGSGGSKTDKDLRAGVALCARAAFVGHIDALRELGHCLQDGYGVRQNVPEGRRFLIQANARELAAVLSSPSSDAVRANSSFPLTWTPQGCCPLLSDFGCNVPLPEGHPANKFLGEWYETRGGKGLAEKGLRMCSHVGCGRPETRRHEFRRCSVCGNVNYCSRACQALDWKLRHKVDCRLVERWVRHDDHHDDDGVEGHNDGHDVDDVDDEYVMES